MSGALSLLAVVALVLGSSLPGLPPVRGAEPPAHLVVSEVVTGGASASDELVELYNPTAGPLPLEGLEVVYVSASGTTVTRRVTWPLGAPVVPSRHHVLLANEAGIFATIADALYSGGMAATGGSVALRIQGATSAVDAVGWGNAASSWMEGSPVPAPAAGESLERLPGGASGSTVDTDANVADFALRPQPDPQNLGSPPTPDPSLPAPTPIPSADPPAASSSATVAPTLGPTPTPDPTPDATVAPTPIATAVPTPVATATPSSGPAAVSIATARALPDGTIVTIEGASLTASDFSDGGGYLADASGGIAVLSAGATYPRDRILRVTGELDDRFGQRTLRPAADGIVDLGPASVTLTVTEVATGGVGETVEGRQVRIAGTITSPASELTTGFAFDVDDGSGPTRLIVGSATGIDVSGWGTGTALVLVGVAGQRDSSGTGVEGYRVQPRDAADVLDVGAPPSPGPTPGSGADASASAEPSASPPPGVLTIAQARAAERNARVRVQGVVTLPTGVVDAGSAVVQDGTGAILLRLSDEAGELRLGQAVDVSGTRSTKSGMESIRVSVPPIELGVVAEPSGIAVSTGAVDESREATLVTVRGALVTSARRSSSGTVSVEVDDGSGPLRVLAGASIGLDRTALVAGAWVEVRGVVGQETTGALPTRGYRVWPRLASDVRVLAAPADGGGSGSAGGGTSDGDDGGGLLPSGATGNLDDLGGSASAGGIVAATLVVGPWREIGVGGILWDGERLVGVAASDAPRIRAATAGARLPVAVELRGLEAAGSAPGLDVPLTTLGGEDASVAASGRPPSAPATSFPTAGEPARWIAVVGRLTGSARTPALRTQAGTVALEVRCDSDDRLPRGLVTVSGVALPGGSSLVVPCGGVLPGSTLARAPLPGRPANGPESAPVTAARASAPTPVGTLAAALLGAASIVLAGLAGWTRYRAGDPPPPADEQARDPARADVEAAERGAPRLTLVSLPRERGP